MLRLQNITKSVRKYTKIRMRNKMFEDRSKEQ